MDTDIIENFVSENDIDELFNFFSKYETEEGVLMLDRNYGSKRGKHKFSFELFSEPLKLKSLLITNWGWRITVPDFQFSFLKKCYINVSFDNVEMIIYISQYVKAKNFMNKNDTNDSS